MGKVPNQKKLANPGVVRVEEFARQLRISVWTARQWAYRGKIASCKPGKLLLIPTSEISRLVGEVSESVTTTYLKEIIGILQAALWHYAEGGNDDNGRHAVEILATLPYDV